ncbi:MAG: methyltransferase domain-containing protein [Simkaniaceae bacterium]|nr:methyltransferase domain-containing protein [Simkaniaceae bacterium]
MDEKNPQILHQPAHSTKFDKYPELFQQAADLFQGSVIKILSFGSSTGEECYTLRKYFPKAKIIGAEIDRLLVNQCKICNQDQEMHFIHSRFSLLKKHSPLDIIFALNVFVRDVACPDLYPLYLFSYFEEQIQQFDQLLSPGGVIAINNSQHDFRKTQLFLEGKYRELKLGEVDFQFFQKN